MVYIDGVHWLDFSLKLLDMKVHCYGPLQYLKLKFYCGIVISNGTNILGLNAKNSVTLSFNFRVYIASNHLTVLIGIL